MDKSVIKDLYYGRIFPCEEKFTTGFRLAFLLMLEIMQKKDL